MTRKLVAQSTLFAHLSKLGCQPCNHRRHQCSYWKAPSGAIFSIIDGDEMTADGKVLYTQDVFDDIIRLVHQLTGAANEREHGSNAQLSLQVWKGTGIRLKDE